MALPDAEKVYAAWLSAAMLPFSALREAFTAFGSAAGIREAMRRNDPAIRDCLAEPEIARLRALLREERLRAWQTAIEAKGIQMMTFLEDAYPARLLDYDDPPAILFYQGSLDCLRAERMLAMVGSRRASRDGLQAAWETARELSRHKVTIVSGLAYGIDAMAHTGCVEGGAPTVAVLGCGLDVNYPSGNTNLRQSILDHRGLLLSEFAPGEQPLGRHFPYRNRIISGLGHALVLMEARIRSGSLTSVQHALNQGKEVFVYPGDPRSELYSGNHQLLREGARYFTTAEDLLEDMNWLDNPAEVGQNSRSPAQAESSLAPGERAIMKALKAGNCSFDQLCQLTGIAPAELMSALTMLQIGGLVEALPGKIYQLKAGR